ncbi:MAG: polyphosphate kinase [Sulfuricurvum sp. PC08-66]|nr:MAG: polyphosphate kinase [Sulfuricurvum sp. PC08-66]
MGHKRVMVSSEIESVELKDIVHPDRRVPPEEQVAEKRNKEGKKRLPVWIKEEVLVYEEELQALQIELLKLQNHIKATGQKVLILFEGRDAAGKGGTIKRITEHLNPRGARIVALDKPSDTERSQWYFQRYSKHLPSAGEMVLFDRSWYNRAGVEPVMEFCTPQEHQDFLENVPFFEHMLVHSGIKLFKFYFSVSKKEQAKRFEKRKTDPLKQYKLSPVDQKSQKLWEEYSKVKLSMLKASHTPHAPWTIVRSDDKKKARLNTIRYMLSQFDYPKKIKSKHIQIDTDIIIDVTNEIIQMEQSFNTKEK